MVRLRELILICGGGEAKRSWNAGDLSFCVVNHSQSLWVPYLLSKFQVEFLASIKIRVLKGLNPANPLIKAECVSPMDLNCGSESFSFRFFQTFSWTDRERQEIRRNTLSNTPSNTQKYPCKNTASKNTRSYRGVPYATNRNYVTIEWLWNCGFA